ncbi:MAG: energy-coupling factor ABC transporter ATP-binding protein [Synergistaceae bacterium]|jgi:cobalt/nickel transport system ATP-binding protein|nr:energy-coupling factor ABC transporter ATP-binding protein [Synergistaceae bacterium]
MLVIKDLTVVYPDGTKALDGVDMSVGPNERVALIGANGAGKSTLLSAIMGLAPTSGGSITMDGLVLSKSTEAEVRRKIGIVFQNPDDQLFMTRIRDDVAFGPRNCGLPREEIEARVDGALGKLRILHLKDRASGRLSGGEKRLAAIAGVLAMNPGMLLLDEPSSFLDPKARRNLIQILSSLPQAVLIATHDLDLASRSFSRVVVLQNGRVRVEGPPDDILSDEKKLEEYGL